MYYVSVSIVHIVESFSLRTSAKALLRIAESPHLVAVLRPGNTRSRASLSHFSSNQQNANRTNCSDWREQFATIP